MSKRYLLIGASAASMGALHKLRQLDPHAHITLFSSEKELPYNKCLLADFLAGITTQDRLHIYRSSGTVTLELDTTIIAIDPVAKMVTSQSGTKYPYDMLFLAMGSSPWVPPIKAIQSAGVFTFHTLADTLKIQDYIQKNGCKKAVVCGGGLSGLEVADALKAQGLSISLVEKNSQVLSSLLTPHAADFLHEHMRSLGIQLLLDRQIKEIAQNDGKVIGAYLSDGTYVSADIMIVATGLRANSALCDQAGIAYGPQGVLVDSYLCTSQAGIYAGGDLIEVTDTLTGNRLRSSMWPDAMQQGMYAAMAMAGQPKPYPGPAVIVSSAFFGLKFAQAGLLYEGEVKMAQNQGYFHYIAQKQGILQGFQVLGRKHDLGLLRRLILTKQPLLDSLDALFE
jgi:NAD(P)H-nitrite reductase large subunit